MAQKESLEWRVQEGFVTAYCRKRFMETEAQKQAVERFVEAQICAAPDHEKCYQLGANALGIVTLSEIKEMDLLQFGSRISIHI